MSNTNASLPGIFVSWEMLEECAAAYDDILDQYIAERNRQNTISLIVVNSPTTQTQTQGLMNKPNAPTTQTPHIVWLQPSKKFYTLELA